MALHATSLLAVAQQEDVDKFWSLVSKVGSCWLWTGTRSPLGYGIFKIGKSATGAHRFAYECEIGPIPSGMVMDHLCKNPSCVRPDHLEPVTQRENVLRGNAPVAITRRLGVCVRGHDLNDEVNIYVAPSGERRCVACLRIVRHERYLRHKRRHGVPDRVPAGTCGAGGCDAKHYAKGLCRRHYDQQRRGRPLD